MSTFFRKKLGQKDKALKHLTTKYFCGQKVKDAIIGVNFYFRKKMRGGARNFFGQIFPQTA